MKKLSDYKGSEAFELWADLFDPVTKIFSDQKIVALTKKGSPLNAIAGKIFKLHPKEIEHILTTIDSTPINGSNLYSRVIEFLKDMFTSEESFFKSAGQENEQKESFGSATENTGDGVK